MKDKLSELESQGITPTREHVLDNLQLIKDISKGLFNKEFNFEMSFPKKKFYDCYLICLAFPISIKHFEYLV